MTTTWPAISMMSLAWGMGLGLVWALWITSRRRQKFLAAAIRPVGQPRWFMLHFCGMSAYLTTIVALGLAAANGLVPSGFAVFLLAMSAAAFISAGQFSSTELPRARPVISLVREPSADPPADPPADPSVVPLRRSA